jgi:hypothetical protein
MATTTAAIPRSTISKVQEERIQQPGPITATTTAELPKQPNNATTLQEDRSYQQKRRERNNCN